MMTVAAVTLSLVPILWSQETGSDVLKRIAAPMVGGLITSAGLTLIVLPAIYSLWRERQLGQLGAQSIHSGVLDRETEPPPVQLVTP
jgi:Cu(I)/Ag(I) efflux system membrane protein CusA/SilA